MLSVICEVFLWFTIEKRTVIDQESEKFERFLDINGDDDSLNFTKIAVEYNFRHKWWSLWSANNICISNEPWYYTIDSLPVDEYVIDKIKEFCIK